MVVKRRKAKADRKDRYFQIRVTKEQKDTLDAAARRANLPSTSAWALQALLDAAGYKPDAGS